MVWVGCNMMTFKHKIDTYLITYTFGSINDKLSLQHHYLVSQWYVFRGAFTLGVRYSSVESPNTMLLI
jgi:hypothetical protein